MPNSEETYIVRVRGSEGDAVVEDARSRRRQHVADLANVGSVMAAWAAAGDAGQRPRSRAHEQGSHRCDRGPLDGTLRVMEISLPTQDPLSIEADRTRARPAEGGV